MRIDRLFFTVAAVPLDFLAVIAAGMVAWSLRQSTRLVEIRPLQFDLPVEEYIGLLMFAGVITVVAIAGMGLYRFPKPELGPFGITFRLLLATLVTLSAASLTMFLQQELFGSRFLVLAGWLFATLFLMLVRTALYWFENMLSRRFKVGLRATLVVGSDDLSEQLVGMIARDPVYGMRVVHRSAAADIDEIEDAAQRLGIEAILIADPNQPRESLSAIIDYANAEHIDVLLVPNVVQALTRNSTASLIGGIPVIELLRTPLAGWGRVQKRLFDIVGSIFFIVLTSPIMLLAVIAILLDSGRPILYGARDDGTPLMRVGKAGKLFRYFKFRSMRQGTDEQRYGKLADRNIRDDGPLVKIIDDPRVTRVGNILRKYSIDELPEFFLVLAGAMSLVGPRPHRPEEVEKYKRHDRRVLAIKPGVTGLAQVSGRSDLQFEDEVRLDTHYIESWSIWLDIKLILLTPFAILFKRHKE